MNDVRAVEFAAIGDAFECGKHAVGGGPRETDFDAGGAGGGLFQFARRAGFDDFAVVHDGDAIAEAFGFFDVMRGQRTVFFSRRSSSMMS